MLGEGRKLLSLMRGVRNPLPAVLDRLGQRRQPYVLRRHDGVSIEVRPGVGDLFGFYEILLRNDYLASGQVLNEGDTVIDVGANIGCFSVLAARVVGPKGRVFAIEPEESTYRQLVRNIELNRLTNVTALKLAVGAECGSLKLHSASNRLFSSFYTSVNGQVVDGIDQDVEVTTLAELMAAHGVLGCDYLKLDCEGAEHEIVRTMSADTAQRIRQITVELHRVPGHDGAVFADRLIELGYEKVGSSTLPYYRRRPV
jgi:FkbM family methyltransferase